MLDLLREISGEISKGIFTDSSIMTKLGLHAQQLVDRIEGETTQDATASE